MHRKIGILILLTVLLGILCAVKTAELEETGSRKNHLIRMKKSAESLANEVKKFRFTVLKSPKKLFAKNPDVKKTAEKIGKKLGVGKVLIKNNTDRNFAEIKVSADEESKVCEFIRTLFFELPGIVDFRSVKFFPSGGSICATATFKILTVEECPGLVFRMAPHPKPDLKSLNMFGLKKIRPHRLLCTIDNCGAYIGDSWFRVGDSIDGQRLTAVFPNSVEIQTDDRRKIRVGLGENW
ncbi:MAG: hypothetical protein LBO73_00485 [Holosporaceae bacterium]|nr:hypothetical protein [Holosporaceae bacterium]